MGKSQIEAASNPVYLMPDQFLRMTKGKSSKIATARAYSDGGNQKFPLPQAGLAHIIWVYIAGTITVAGTVTSGKWKGLPAPAPWSLIKRVRFGSNTSFNMRDLSGLGWYRWIRERYGFDPLSTGADATNSAGMIAALGLTNTTEIVAGADIAAGTYTFNTCLPLPISYNNAAEVGMIILQSNSVQYELSIDWGTVTGGISATGGSNDLIAALVGTGLSVTADIKTTVGLDWFEAVPGIDNLVSMFMNVSELTKTPLNIGANVVQPPPNEFYTMFNLLATNNGAAVAVGDIQNLIFRHSGAAYDYQDDNIIQACRNWYMKRIPPMDGSVTWDLGLRRGILARRDWLDAFDNRNVTGLELEFTLPSSVTIGAPDQVSVVMESMRNISQNRR